MILQLRNRALLRLSGGDTQTFLQGQLSNDIDGLEEGEVQLNAYCQHQGKIIALLWVMKRDDDFYLSLKPYICSKFAFICIFFANKC